MLMLMVERCADAAVPPPEPGDVAAGADGFTVRPVAGPGRCELLHADNASATTALAAKNLMFMVLTR
jgi:hypothetical protein